MCSALLETLEENICASFDNLHFFFLEPTFKNLQSRTRKKKSNVVLFPLVFALCDIDGHDRANRLNYGFVFVQKPVIIEHERLVPEKLRKKRSETLFKKKVESKLQYQERSNSSEHCH